MASNHLCTWKSLITLILLTPLQLYIIYRAIFKYLQLKHESVNNHLVFYSQYQWIHYLLNLQLFTIVFAIGLCPLWICCVLLGTSRVKCKRNTSSTSSPSNYYENHFSTDGLYYRVWKKTDRIAELFQEYDDVNRGKEFKISRIECIAFYPIGALLHLLIAFSLYIPTPFIDSWILISSEGDKESPWKSGLDSLFGQPNLQVQLDFSLEYLNLCLSLFLYSTQYTQLLWTINPLYSLLLFFIQLFTTTNILLDCSVVSVFIKTYFQIPDSHLSLKSTEKISVFLKPYFILPISLLSNIYLILLTLMNFQIGYIKCVESFSNYSVNLMNLDLFGTSSNITSTTNTTMHNNINNLMSSNDNKGGESMVNSNDNNNNHMKFGINYHKINNKTISTTDTNNQLKIQQNPTPILLSLLLIFVDISMKVIRYFYGHNQHLNMSKIFYIYIIHSSLMIVAYIFYWIWVLTKQKWKFKITNQHVRFSSNPVLRSVEYNIYKTLPVNTNHNNNISLCSISNPINNSFRSNTTDSSMIHPSSMTNLQILSNPMDQQQHQLSQSFINLSQMSPQQQHNQLGRSYRTMYSCNPSMNKGSESLEINGRNTKQSSSFSFYRGMHPPLTNTNSLPMTRTSSPDASIISSVKYSDYFRLNSATPTTQIINNPTPAILEETDADQHERIDAENDNDTGSCITDDTDDINMKLHNINQSNSGIRKSSNHNTPGSNTKFVTFQLDDPSKDSNNNSSSLSQEYYPNNEPASDDNLTLISMDANPDNFLRELEAGDVLNNNNGMVIANDVENVHLTNPIKPFQGYNVKRKPVEIMPIILSKLNEGSQV